MLTPDDLAARTDRAVAAATDAGRGLGITVTDPRVLYDVFSTIVHLSPAPVVVRVPTVLPRTVAADPDAQAAQQRSELAAAGWLADRDHPVVPPSPLMPREPVRRDGFSMTFWQFVEQVPDADPDAERRATVTAHLHAALREYPVELPFLVPLDPFVPDGLAQLEGREDLFDAADLDRARREWAVLEPRICSRTAFEAAFPEADVQPIQLAYNAAAARLGMRPLDERLLRVMESARMLQVVACLALVPQLPMLAEGLRPLLDHWRTTPVVGTYCTPGTVSSEPYRPADRHRRRAGTMNRTDRALIGERADLLEALAKHRYFLRYTVRDLTDEQVARRTTVSELCLGGLVKHVTFTERQWISFILDGPSAMGSWEEGSFLDDRSEDFSMLEGETLAGLLDEYERVAGRTDELVVTLPDLGISHPLPEAPWFAPGTRWSALRVLLHVIAETAQHAGHADIIRESLDGAKSMG